MKEVNVDLQRQNPQRLKYRGNVFVCLTSQTHCEATWLPHTHTHTHIHTHTRTHSNTHTHSRAHAHAHTHTHARREGERAKERAREKEREKERERHGVRFDIFTIRFVFVGCHESIIDLTCSLFMFFFGCHEPIMWQTWLIHVCHDPFIQITPEVFGVKETYSYGTHSYGTHMTHPYMCHDPFICVTWPIHMCDKMLVHIGRMTHS